MPYICGLCKRAHDSAENVRNCCSLAKLMVTLRYEATTKASELNHRLLWKAVSETKEYGECVTCRAGVFVLGNPRPNEENLVGDAIARKCRKRFKR